MYRSRPYILLLLLALLVPTVVQAQDGLKFKGQLSGWMLYNGNNELQLYSGGRYIPQLNYSVSTKKDYLIDFEASGNIYGLAGTLPFDTLYSSGDLKPYRIWARYSTNQFELRLGLQKINFGSASMLRPLMWFDQVDPRDPLRFTDGVWGMLGRYYFLNNANIWFWALYGNDNPRGWEPVGSKKDVPELGGRLQLPLNKGEIAFSYNYRTADSREISIANPEIQAFGRIPENKFGFDIKLDLVVGLWLEGSVTSKNKDLGMFSNQEIYNAGIDYTFGIGNGLYLVYEQLFASYNEKVFGFKNTTSFSLLSLSYPIGLFDNISGIVYYDWLSNKSYNFINWQKSFNNLSFYLMAFWNPEKFNIPTQTTDQNLMAGRGIQIMLVYNH
ncbi:MAG: hypothetical protein QNK33_04015 [Bacteroidales bacterium]|nr:hypothetical protein [Bacteroidales bacterium]